MPSIDSGRYFLTVLLPIKETPLIEEGGANLSPTQAIRHHLSVWATAKQDPMSVESDRNSPFAENLRTHFVRIFVINDVIYNGRNPSNVLADTVRGALGDKGANLLIPQPVDQLSSPYLAFVADIDAPNEEEAELDSWLDEIWSQMSKRMIQIFSYCEGFENVKDASTFRKYMRAGKLDTTMPFNDYWEGLPPLKNFWNTPWIVPTIVAGILTVILCFAHSWWWLISGAIGTFVVAAISAYLYGSQGFPMAPNSDLKSVLKSLYLQRRYLDFAIANQGADADALYKNFATFMEEEKPESVGVPTQEPGVLGIDMKTGVLGLEITK
ncbi:MAG: hypothetical protein AAF468_14190 [Pseudomonadota bacterium]